MSRNGFFSSSELQVVKSPTLEIPRCGACKLERNCESPKIEVVGEGRKKILIVGDAPGKEEDRQGVHFIGQPGEYLRDALVDLNIDVERDCWLTNSIICRPHTAQDKNRVPTDKEIEYCRPNLFNSINKLDPNVIILLGPVAVNSLIGGVWKEEAGEAIGKWVGWNIPLHKPNAWICPTWHPTHIIKNSDDGVLAKFFKEHLFNAVSLKNKPWPKGPPDYKSKVKVIINPEEAAEEIRAIIRKKPRLAAFDYETSTLKPEGAKARVVCCSISDGKTTISYPWHGVTRLATQEFIKDKDIGKCASNLKFESRWTMKEFGHKVVNWKWCTVLGGHTLDNRSGVCGLKFQSFVLLGQGAYDTHISPYLKSVKPGCNEENRTKEVGLRELLLYCGMDSLLEIEVAKKQMNRIGIDWES